MNFLKIIRVKKVQLPLVLVLAAVIIFACYGISVRIFKSIEKDEGQTKIEFYQAIVENELTRLEHLPALLSQDFLTEEYDDLNIKLKQISTSSQAEAIFVLDSTGLTVAASNFDQSITFLGQNYGFRPYFLSAMQGQESSFFAIGATTSRPGYFLAAPITRAGDPVGAMVVKIDLTALNRVLESAEEVVLVTNTDGVVILSSDEKQLYRTTTPIAQDRLIEIAGERQFGTKQLEPVGWKMKDEGAELDGHSFSMLQRPLNVNSWQLHFFLDDNVAKTRALTVSALLAAFMVGLATVFLFWREQRVRNALIQSQHQRRKLQKEIEVRRKAEERLERAQKELKRTSKMAALGQLSASVTHELGQPISAMKNYIAAELINNDDPPKVLGNLSEVAKRMENITKQLRTFASNREEPKSVFNIQDVIRDAVSLMQHDLVENDIELQSILSENPIFVSGTRQRLEQVFINIIRNSIAALRDEVKKKIEIKTVSQDQFVIIWVTDNGHGLQGQNPEDIIEPFHTTGPSGEGMGLGLAISTAIIEEHSGYFSAGDNPSGGVRVQIKLPLALESTDEQAKTDI